MLFKKATMALGGFLFLALLAIPCGAQVKLKDISKFNFDCSGLLSGADTSPQTATCKGRFIGDNATLTFTLNNIGVVQPLMPGLVNCAFKATSGAATIVTEDGDTISMQLGGAGCATASGAGTGRFAIAYWIDSGTGKFSNSKGTGTFSVGFDQPGGDLLVSGAGSITGVAKEGED